MPAMEVDDDLLGDTLSLRRNMFVCHNEREEYLDQRRMKKMRWDRNESYGCSGLQFDNPAASKTEMVPTEYPALKNVDILENIAMHLPEDDLLSCRLVCKQWSVEMASFLFKRKSLIVVDGECYRQAESLLKKRLEGHPIALSKLSLFGVDAGCLLYSRLFSVFGLTLAYVSLEDCNLSPKDLNQMPLLNAPNISNLHLREGNKLLKRRTSTFKQIKACHKGQLLLPKLKVLHWDEEHGKTDLIDFVKACPNLVSLELRNFPTPRSRDFRNLEWTSLTNLFLSPGNCLSDDHCKALTHLKLKLKKLTLFGIHAGDRTHVKALNKFLSTLADTLETLELWLDYASLLSEPRTESYSPLPVFLPKVKRLLTETEIVGHINNLAKFPSLTELEVVSNTFEGQNWQGLTKRATIQHQSSLQSFRCGDIDSSSLNKVMRAFPCITSLHLYATYVNDAFLRSIIKNLTSLEDLTINPCMKTTVLRLTDSGITGVPTELCKKFNRNPKECENIDISAAKTKPGISDLKLLKKLDLCLQNSEMSDAAIFFSISMLTNLSSLRLPLCKITDASLIVLEERLPRLVVLGIAGCRNITQDAIDNLKRRRSSIFIEREITPSLESILRE